VSAWQHLVSRFQSLQAERQEHVAFQVEHAAQRAAWDAWAAVASQAAICSLAEMLSDRVAAIQRVSGCEIRLLPVETASAGGYGVEALRLTLPPCHVDIYAARVSGELPRIHVALATQHRRSRARMVSLPGYTIVPGVGSGFRLRGDDGRGSSIYVPLEQLVLEALALLAGSCRSLGYARA
jgi:hypothetical protein